LAGVMVFVFYQFSPSPLFFNEHVEEKMMATPDAAAYAQLQETWYQEHQNRMSLYEPVKEGPDAAIDREQLQSSVALEKSLRADAKSLINKNLPEEETNDRDYVFIRFILDFLPKGIIGLLIAAILAAGMSSTAAELNALASTTTVDFYKRLFKNAGSDKHYVVASKLFTVMWGLIA